MTKDQRTMRRFGVVTDATSATKPLVRLDGDTTPAPTPNYAVGYTPANGHRVLVLVTGSDRELIGKKP